MLRLCTMDLPNFTFPPDFNFQCSGSSLMAGRLFHATFPYSQSFDSRIDWDDPSLYQSLPPLSELLNECHNTRDMLLPPAPQKNASDASHAVNASQQTNECHDTRDTLLPPAPQKNASDASQQATLPAGREVANLNGAGLHHITSDY